MARKDKTITIQGNPAENRDVGKSYYIKEMPSAKAEKWAARALIALIAAGVNVPDSATRRGIAGLASVGVGAFASSTSPIPWDLLEPLLDEMMTCVSIMEGKAGVPIPRALFGEDDIEEVSTRLLLRKEILELHLGFSLAASHSMSDLAAENQSTSTQT